MFQPMHSLYHNGNTILNMVSLKCQKLCFDSTQNVYRYHKVIGLITVNTRTPV